MTFAYTWHPAQTIRIEHEKLQAWHTAQVLCVAFAGGIGGLIAQVVFTARCIQERSNDA
jgi:hypothetical protein